MLMVVNTFAIFVCCITDYCTSGKEYVVVMYLLGTHYLSMISLHVCLLLPSGLWANGPQDIVKGKKYAYRIQMGDEIAWIAMKKQKATQKSINS